MTTLLELAKKLHNTLALYNGAGHALGWKTEKVDKLLDESKRVIELATQPAQQQEPIYQIKGFDTGNAWHDASHDAYDMTLSRDRRIVYTSPQPAQRKPLDAGEISRLWKQHTSEDGPHHNPYDDDGLGFARAIEAKLKEKNT